MHHLGPKYIVWDKSSTIQFLAPGRGTVYADIRISKQEVQTVKELAANHSPVYRQYQLNIYDDSGVRIAEVQKPFISALNRAKASLERLNNKI